MVELEYIVGVKPAMHAQGLQSGFCSLTSLFGHYEFVGLVGRPSNENVVGCGELHARHS